jgi:hypothetical protein
MECRGIMVDHKIDGSHIPLSELGQYVLHQGCPQSLPLKIGDDCEFLNRSAKLSKHGAKRKSGYRSLGFDAPAASRVSVQ